MARKYFTLLEKIDGAWTIQFGDYDCECVAFELDGLAYSRSIIDDISEAKARMLFKIIATADAKQATIDAAVAALNA